MDLFERRFSVDGTVRRHKPVPEAYQSVTAALEADPGDICLIASHIWDTLGAVAASWQAALILRAGNAPLDVGPQPGYIGKGPQRDRRPADRAVRRGGEQTSRERS